MVQTEHVLRVALIAGESSGDVLGARLMIAMRLQNGPIEFTGVGGPLMEVEGLRSLFPMHELSVMGILEIFPNIRRLLRRIKQTVDFINRTKPDIVVTIDSPDFSFRVARSICKTAGNLPLKVHYVAPTVWAWRPERAAKVAHLYDGLICLLPFEPDYFIREGMSAAFTGHPAIENKKDLADGMKFRRRYGIPHDALTIGLLFGSRRGELNRMGSIIRDSARRAIEQAGIHAPVHLIVPTLPHLEDKVRALLGVIRDGKLQIHVLTDPAQKWNAFAAMDAAVAVSGTIGLELALSGVPHVIAYRLNRLTYEIIRRKIKVKYAHLGNILLDSATVPEFIQNDCNVEAIAPVLSRLLVSNGTLATALRTAFSSLQDKLSGDKTSDPSEQAARYILSLFSEKTDTLNLQ